MPAGTNIIAHECPPTLAAAQKHVAKLRSRIEHALADAEAARVAGDATRCKSAQYKARNWAQMLGSSMSGKIVALDAAYEGARFKKNRPQGEAFYAAAAALSLIRPGTEQIHIKAVNKKRYPDFRPIHAFGPAETARQLLFGWCAQPFMPVEPNQYATRNGGRPAAIKRMLELVENETFRFVATLDIKDFYPNVCRDWLKANLPVGVRVSANVVLAENSHTRSRLSGYGLASAFHCLSSCSLTYASRQGLLQGAASSSIVADAIVAQVLGTLHPTKAIADVELVNYADNFALLARTRRELEAAIQSLSAAFGQHPAGDMRLTCDGIKRLSDGFVFLGYQIKRVRGKVEAVPTGKNVEKFARKFDRLAARQVVGEDAGGKEMLRAVKAWRAAFREWQAGDFWILARLRAYDRALPDARRALQSVFRKLVERDRRQISALLAA
ncbi:hypothetical protein [Rhizobium jaguaris]|uniref:Reverse transcriptase domain-containing protein n=1 Tax=Rhizobium jaguaris TaxID=1312183 RepID=A0A387FQK4_9HYPH|nr:hypothetical protein [Rhizobium jaguaris]AYG59685.1 hypothetical protein CCGE525_13400 [Rhizobium jaguaris]